MTKDSGSASFNFCNKKFEIKITYGFARKVLNEEFGINLLTLFEANNIDQMMMKISLNDEFALDLWWYFVKEHFSDKEASIDKLTPDDMTEFKEALWAAIMNFFDPMRREMLLQFKKHFKTLLIDQIKSQISQSLKDSSDSLLSSSSEKQELTQEV